MSNKIESITIKNVKGIKEKTLLLEAHANIPIILVAPNGFGKTSLSIAFERLNRDGISFKKNRKPEKKYYYEENIENKPSLTIKVEGINDPLVADEFQNTIGKEFKWHVINSKVKPSTSSKSFDGISISSASLEVEPIELISKIPKSSNFNNYKVTEYRKKMSQNGGVFSNISEILQNKQFILKLHEKDYLKKFKTESTGLKKSNIILQFKKGIIDANGTIDDIKKNLSFDELSKLESVENVAQDLKRDLDYSEIESYLKALQLLEILLLSYEGKHLTKIIKYYEYCLEKEFYEKHLKYFETTWKDIKPKVSDGKYVLTFPKAHQISNGQRDVLIIIAGLLQAQYKLNGKKNILIIDEVFDYLDDANTISAQYYILKLIEKIKNDKRDIYPIILTHLDPIYFQHFLFENMQLKYAFSTRKQPPNRNVERLLICRDHVKLKADMGKYFVHYHPTKGEIKSEDIEAVKKEKKYKSVLNGLSNEFLKSEVFKDYCKKQFEAYLNNKKYDPIATSLGIRIKIEEYAYGKLEKEEQKNYFLEEMNRGTREKLDFVKKDCKIELPEYFWLLGIIYNETAHLERLENDNYSALFSKLENATIRHLLNKLKQLSEEVTPCS